MRSFWDRYDALDGGSKVFTSLISSLKRLATEKPALLGVGHQMLGVGVGDGGSRFRGHGRYGSERRDTNRHGGAGLWCPRSWLEFSLIVYEVAMVRTDVSSQFPPIAQQFIGPLQH